MPDEMTIATSEYEAAAEPRIRGSTRSWISAEVDGLQIAETKPTSLPSSVS